MTREQLTTWITQLAQELLTDVQCSGVSSSFAKECLEDEKCGVQPLEVDNDSDNWEPSSNLIILQLHEKLPKNSTSTIPVIQHLRQLRWKSSVSGCLMSWPKILKKKVVLKYRLLLFYATTTNYFSIRLGRATKSGFYTTSSSVVGPRSSEVLPKAKLAPKKAMVTVQWSAADLIHYSFLNPSKTITS